LALRAAFAAMARPQAWNELLMRASRALAEGKQWHHAGLAPGRWKAMAQACPLAFVNR
jgi:hypothetical protein